MSSLVIARKMDSDVGKKHQNGQIQTDAVESKIHYRSVLKQIDEQLMKRDIKTLIFLTSDIIPASRLEEIHRGIELFDELELKNRLSPDNLTFLAELFYRIQRIDLLKKLDFTHNEIKDMVQRGDTQLTKFRLLLFDVIEDLTLADCKALKYVIQPSIPRLNKEASKDPLLMFSMMEKAQVLAQDNVDTLQKALTSIGRDDLNDKVIAYKEATGTSKSRSHQSNVNEQKAFKSEHQNVANRTEIHVGRLNEPQPQPVTRVPTTVRPFEAGSSADTEIQNEREAAAPSPQMIPNTVMSFRSATESGRDLLAVSGVHDFNREIPGAADENISVHEGEARIQVRSECPPMLPSQEDRMRNQENQRAMEDREEEIERLRALVENLQATPDTIPSYEMKAKPRGLCIIISNEKFFQIPGDRDSKRMEDRKGTEVDNGNLHFIFNKLDFEVYSHENLTKQDMISVMLSTARKDHSRYDCFACCILTHGEAQSVYGADGKRVPIRELTKFFTADTCPTLMNKPKLFFIQACQGKDPMEAVTLHRDAPSDGREETIPNEADFLLSYATLPGYVSFRSSTHGSWFITKLVEMLDIHANREDLLSILLRVNGEVGQAIAKIHGGIYKQIPAPMFTLRKKLYLKS